MEDRQSFFAHPEQFEHLQRRVLPRLIDYARKGHRLRIWSAGCGHGEEAYSIAMTILDVAPDARSLDIRIVASDADAAALDHARAAIYEVADTRGVPELFKARWMEPVKQLTGKCYRLDAAVRDLVKFEQLDLGMPIHTRTYFNVIFCRNALSGKQEEARPRIWAGMMPFLAPGGTLYTGSSERITGPALRELTIAGNATYLRLAA